MLGGAARCFSSVSGFHRGSHLGIQGDFVVIKYFATTNYYGCAAMLSGGFYYFCQESTVESSESIFGSHAHQRDGGYPGGSGEHRHIAILHIVLTLPQYRILPLPCPCLSDQLRPWPERCRNGINACAQGRVHKMGISLCRLHLAVAQQLADHFEGRSAADQQ